jgi:mRNA-degrading endonuclease RelE of RelBE toxin-antitoxin system
MPRSKNSTLPISENKMRGITMETNNENLLLLKLGNSHHRRRNIAKSKVEEKAIQKYRAGGYGLKYKVTI